MIKNKHLAAFAAVAALGITCAYANGLVTSVNNPFYLKLGTGASFSNDADISVDQTFWDPTPNGYDANLGTSEFYEFGVGYILCPLLSMDVTGTWRPNYSYEKFQTSNSTNAGALGDKTRFFDLESKDILVNLYVHGAGISNRLVYQFSNHDTIQPFIGAGIGVAYNTVSNFHSVLSDRSVEIPTLHQVASTEPDNQSTSFAYQGTAGLEYTHNRFNVDVAYRYFNGGNFRSNNYFLTAPQNEPNSITAPRWKGTLAANEVVVDLRYAI